MKVNPADLTKFSPCPDSTAEVIFEHWKRRGGLMADLFRKRPVTVEAMRLSGTTGEIHAVYQWVESNTLGSFEPMAVIEGREPYPASGVSIDPRDGRFIISTLEGLHWADPGDWIIRGVAGEFYPCKPDIFDATYMPADEPDAAEARAVAAEVAAEGWRQQAQRDRPIVAAAREYAAADAAYHEATTGWTEHGEAREWRLRNDARLALLAAVAASPTTERTPS